MSRVNFLMVTLLIVLFAGVPTMAMVAERGFKTVGNGESEEFDTKGFSQQQLEASALLKKHCTCCHTESRIINALRAHNSNYRDAYESYVKATVVKKVRLTSGDISRQDGKKIMEFLSTL